MSDEFHAVLMETAPYEFTAKSLRPRELKNLGRVQLWWCGRAGHEADGTGAAADRRRNTRWERISEVLRDLEELRDVGERMLTANRSASDRGTGDADADADIDDAVGDGTAGTESVAVQPSGGDAEGA